jgi:hypothetical protein
MNKVPAQEKSPGREPQAFLRATLLPSDLVRDHAGSGRYAFLTASKDRATWFLIGSAVSAAILLVSALISPA